MVLFFHALNGLPDECCNKESKMLKVTFRAFSPRLKEEFIIVELHRSLADAQHRALGLMWTIAKVEEA
jgi:hypothetical protein